MGELHNCSNLIDVEVTQWKSTSFNKLRDNSNLFVITYHDAHGSMVSDCLDNAGNLKPLADGPVADCRPNDIVYARIKGTINFDDLSLSTKAINVPFFLRLPTSTTVIANTAATPRNVTTFDGPSDWLTIDTDAYQTLIYSHLEAIDVPFDLNPPDFTSPITQIDTESSEIKITDNIIKAAYPTILEQIFKQTCPNFIDDPFDTLNKVHQSTTLADGSDFESSVREYHNMIQTVLTTFPRNVDSEWSANRSGNS